MLIIILVILAFQFKPLMPKNIYKDDLREFNQAAHEYYELFLNPKSLIDLAHNRFNNVMTTEASSIDAVVYNYLKVVPKLSADQRIIIFNDIFQHHTFMAVFLKHIIQDRINHSGSLSQNDYDNALPIFDKVLFRLAQDILDIESEQVKYFNFKNIYVIEEHLYSSADREAY